MLNHFTFSLEVLVAAYSSVNSAALAQSHWVICIGDTFHLFGNWWRSLEGLEPPDSSVQSPSQPSTRPTPPSPCVVLCMFIDAEDFAHAKVDLEIKSVASPVEEIPT